MSIKDISIYRDEDPPDPDEPFTKMDVFRIVKNTGPKIGKQLKGCYPRLKDHDIEEILGTASLQFWMYRHSYNRDKGSPDAWYFRIAVNVAMTYLRTKMRLDKVLFGLIEAELREIENLDLSDGVQGESNQLLLDAAEFFSTLTEADRKIVIASDIEGYEWTGGLAEELKMRPGTMRVHLHRIKDKFRLFMTSRGHSLTKES